MEFTSPTKNSNGTYTVNIEVMNTLKIQYNSDESNKHTTPPTDYLDFKKYVGEIATLYEPYSQKWFSRPVLPTMFLSRVMHKWNNGSHLPYNGRPPYSVYQEWCPEQLLINSQNFTILWKLEKVVYNIPIRVSPSGPVEITSDEILCDSTEATLALQTTLRSRALRKVRQARLVYTIAKARAEQLTVRYYEKYGELEADSNSVLSSDSG